MYGFQTIALSLLLLGLLPFVATFPESSRLVTCHASPDSTTDEQRLQVACGYAGQESDVRYYEILRIPDEASPYSDYKKLMSCAVNGGTEPKCQKVDVMDYTTTPGVKCNVTAFVNFSLPGPFACRYITSAGNLISFCKFEATTAEPTTSATTTTEKSLEQDKIPNEKHEEEDDSWEWNSLTTALLIVLTTASFGVGVLVGNGLAYIKKGDKTVTLGACWKQFKQNRQLTVEEESRKRLQAVLEGACCKQSQQNSHTVDQESSIPLNAPDEALKRIGFV